MGTVSEKLGRRVGLVGLVMMLSGCGDGGSSSSNAAAPGSSGNPATAPLDYLAAQGQGKKRSEKVVSLVQVQQALQHFQATEDRWPKDLNELVQAGLLVAVPEAPAGQRLVYDSSAGTVRFLPSPR